MHQAGSFTGHQQTTSLAPYRQFNVAPDKRGFASLAGASPIPASSGNTQRHRLNRGGDRQLNQALHTVILVRIRTDPDTKTYVEKRAQEGKNKRETMRCLKRYLARKIHRTLTTECASTANTELPEKAA